MYEDPSAKIEVRLNIPAVNYMAAAQEIMSQYSEVVKDAMNEIEADLMFNEKFQEEIKFAVKSRLDDAVQKAIKNAAERVVWDVFMDKEADYNIQSIIETEVMKALRKKKD